MATQIKGMVDDFLRKLPKQGTKLAAHVKADLLLVNCIDCRYPHAIHAYMHSEHPGEVYDHLVLAGAALASTVTHTGKADWASTFEEHVGLAIDLHEIDGVLVLDHRACGAYVKFGLLSETDHNTQREVDQHRMVALDSAFIIENVFKAKGRQGHLAYYLTPEIPVGAGDFPSAPLLLVELDV